MEEMRRKGEIAQSPELTAAVTLLLAVYLLNSRLPKLLEGLAGVMRSSFSALGRTDLTALSLHSSGASLVLGLATAWMPFFLTLVVVGIVVGLIQTRGLVTFSRLKPSLSHVNPVSGLKRVFSTRGLFETGKGLIKMAVLGVILYQTLRDLPNQLALTSQASLGAGIATLGTAVSKMARQGALLLVLAAGIDYAYQFRQHRQRMKMTREEVREELKSSEGQPWIKAKIRQLQRRMSRQRMMQELARADVVVTNPTHLAIALRYDKTSMLAPIVVAKGRGTIAERIVQKTRELKIPIVQNIPLAHALIHVEIGSQIPVTLYQAVAEVLAFVYRLRRETPPAARPGVRMSQAI